MWVALSVAVTIGSVTTGAGHPWPGEKEVFFLGFSADESSVAWRLDIKKTDPGGRYSDHYTLVRVADARINQTTATYRASAIRRVGRSGGPIDVPVEILSTMNPQWRDAAPQDAWLELDDQAHFSIRAVDNASSIEVVNDPDVTLQSSVEERLVRLRGEPYGALGFSLAFRGTRLVHLGRFRQEAERGETLLATVQVFESKSGRFIALLSRFERDSGGQILTYGKVAAIPERCRSSGQAPPGADGAVPMTTAPSSTLKTMITNLHKSTMELY